MGASMGASVGEAIGVNDVTDNGERPILGAGDGDGDGTGATPGAGDGEGEGAGAGAGVVVVTQVPPVQTVLWVTLPLDAVAIAFVPEPEVCTRGEVKLAASPSGQPDRGRSGNWHALDVGVWCDEKAQLEH